MATSYIESPYQFQLVRLHAVVRNFSGLLHWDSRLHPIECIVDWNDSAFPNLFRGCIFRPRHGRRVLQIYSICRSIISNNWSFHDKRMHEILSTVPFTGSLSGLGQWAPILSGCCVGSDIFPTKEKSISTLICRLWRCNWRHGIPSNCSIASS